MMALFYYQDQTALSKCFVIHICLLSWEYGVPLRSKYPDSEMLFQKQNISRDLQNMMRKLYFIDPDQKKFEFHFSIIRLPMEKKKFEVENSMTSRIEKRVECKKKNSKSRF